MARDKQFNRDQVSDALKKAGISQEQQDAALAALGGAAPATRQSRGAGAAEAPSTSFTV